tara:strand:- start:1620 stop:2219 length:600 start_codon:yes stop_codon:yes gene_type:complete
MDIYEAWELFSRKYKVLTTKDRTSVVSRAAFSNACLHSNFVDRDFTGIIERDRCTVYFYRDNHKSFGTKLYNPTTYSLYLDSYNYAFDLLKSNVGDTFDPKMYSELVTKNNYLVSDLAYYKSAYKKARQRLKENGIEVRNTRKTPVNQLTKQGVFVKQYTSFSQASRITGMHRSSIEGAASGRQKTAGGYIWERQGKYD